MSYVTAVGTFKSARQTRVLKCHPYRKQSKSSTGKDKVQATAKSRTLEARRAPRVAAGDRHADERTEHAKRRSCEKDTPIGETADGGARTNQRRTRTFLPPTPERDAAGEERRQAR
eukprot:4753529-Pleurochrysis_carterae.AAC.1